MDKIDELKPCPFCGGEARTLQVKMDVAIVFCVGCGATTSKHFDIRGCVEIWNTRPIEDELRAQLAAWEALINRLVAVGQQLFDSGWGLTDSSEPFDEWRALVAEVKLQKMLKEDGTLLEYLRSQKELID